MAATRLPAKSYTDFGRRNTLINFKTPAGHRVKIYYHFVPLSQLKIIYLKYDLGDKIKQFPSHICHKVNSIFLDRAK